MQPLNFITIDVSSNLTPPIHSRQHAMELVCIELALRYRNAAELQLATCVPLLLI
jgi:hypothetical protein